MGQMKKVGEVEEGASGSLLLRNWPAFVEWSTRAVRDAFFASPQLPRLLKPESLKGTIVRGVAGKQLAYVGKGSGGRYEPFHFGDSLAEEAVELSDEMLFIPAEEPKTHIQPRRLPTSPVP